MAAAAAASSSSNGQATLSRLRRNHRSDASPLTSFLFFLSNPFFRFETLAAWVHHRWESPVLAPPRWTSVGGSKFLMTRTEKAELA
ncbi:putative pectinesterase/pectinesterase inhibitor 60-like protein [Corchorus olitorius]|uniref:Pectinesterase/pectinesterase inhibitor 60-like protein n=1 Tax=Corchorus olitorius TaxID=93759 RepID=A0A1R3FZI1_9ROSI|nr:putative pectinesterase/pectinesterase inhibitor 60-like protein [Corchorus olitorius]